MSMTRSTSETLSLEIPSEEAEPGLVGDLVMLTKARLSMFVVITAFVGYCMAADRQFDWLRMMNAVLGTALAAAAAAVLNQVYEAKVDRLMERTRTRPLPAGRMRRRTALALGVGLTVLGVGYLQLTVNTVSAILAATTVFLYVLVYTPMKRKTSFCVTVGAVAGAIPPMIGWTSVHSRFDFGAWVLFGILFTWQMPHFLAIAWMYRDEYAQAGFTMLKRNDPTGSATASQSMLYTLGLSLISLLPFTAGLTGISYLFGALLLDAGLLAFAAQFLIQRERSSARQLFFASILYLPLLLGLMVCAKA